MRTARVCEGCEMWHDKDRSCYFPKHRLSSLKWGEHPLITHGAYSDMEANRCCASLSVHTAQCSFSLTACSEGDLWSPCMCIHCVLTVTVCECDTMSFESISLPICGRLFVALSVCTSISHVCFSAFLSHSLSLSLFLSLPPFFCFSHTPPSLFFSLPRLLVSVFL